MKEGDVLVNKPNLNGAQTMYRIALLQQGVQPSSSFAPHILPVFDLKSGALKDAWPLSRFIRSFWFAALCGANVFSFLG